MTAPNTDVNPTIVPLSQRSLPIFSVCRRVFLASSAAFPRVLRG